MRSRWRIAVVLGRRIVLFRHGLEIGEKGQYTDGRLGAQIPDSAAPQAR